MWGAPAPTDRYTWLSVVLSGYVDKKGLAITGPNILPRGEPKRVAWRNIALLSVPPSCMHIKEDAKTAT